MAIKATMTERPRRATAIAAIRFAAAFAALALAAAGCAISSAEYERRVAQAYLDAGLMRSDIDPADAPFTNADLVANFEKVVFDREAQLLQYAPEAAEQPRLLRRWAGPVRARFAGDAYGAADIDDFRRLAERVAAATGLDIALVPRDGAEKANMLIMVLSPVARAQWLLRGVDKTDAEKDVVDRLADRPLVREWLAGRTVPCMALSYTRQEPHVLAGAVLLVKGELNALWRESCLHEEFVQSLGLANDHNDVRPSLFNDTNEFAFMTRHDEYLLRVLYDPRLRPGMTRAQAMAVAPEVVNELRPGG